MKNLRILMISYTSFLQKFYQTLPSRIASLSGARVKVLVPLYWKELWSNGKTFLERPEDANFELITGKIVAAGNLHFSFFITQLRQILKQYKPHIIDMENEPFNAGSFQIAYFRNLYTPASKLVLHASQHVFKRYPPPFNLIESYTLNNADAILVRNSMAREVLIKKGYRGTLELITHGVDTEAFKPRDCRTPDPALSKNGKIVIGYVGSLVEHKGIDLLLKAAVGISCKIVLIGDGKQKSELEKMARENNIDAIFLPSLSHTEIAAHMNCFDIFVLPSRTTLNWVEKFGRVLIEAMASGIPVIGSTCGEIPNVISGSGLIFQENSIDDLRSKMLELINHPQIRAQLSKKARAKAVINYSWEHIAQNTLNIYYQLLDKN